MCALYRRTTKGEALARIYSIPIPKQPDLSISYNGVSALFMKNHTLRNLLKEAPTQCCENDPDRVKTRSIGDDYNNNAKCM
jgi:hypothetical protein